MSPVEFSRGDIIRHIPSGTICICMRVDEVDGIVYILGRVRHVPSSGNHDGRFLRYASIEWELAESGPKE